MIDDIPTPKDAEKRQILNYLKKHRRVTHTDMDRDCTASAWKRTNYLAQLRRDGHLSDCGRDAKGRLVMTIFDLKDAQVASARRRNTREGAIWTIMRTMTTFSTTDIEAALVGCAEPISPADIRKYCSVLIKANYLKVLEKARHGVRPARYRLINDSGPLPPIEKTMAVVLDTNEDRAVYIAGGRL